jgi:hypothetical protein
MSRWVDEAFAFHGWKRGDVGLLSALRAGGSAASALPDRLEQPV